MKKIVSIFIVLAIMTMCLFGCGTTEDVSDATAEPTAEATESTEYKTTLYTEFDTTCIKTMGDYKTRTMTKDLSVTYTDIVESYADTMESIYDIDSEDTDAEENELTAKATFEKMIDKTGVIEKNDIICFDYVGKIDGETFSGGTASDVISVMGAGNYISGFEESIIGQKAGTTFDINVTFPEKYSSELAGKDAVFTITVDFIFPEISDDSIELINTFSGSEYKDHFAYIDAKYEELVESYESSFESNFLSSALNAIYKDTEFGDLPESEITNLKQYYTDMAEYYGYDLSTYMKRAYSYTTDEQIESFFTYNVSIFAIIANIVKTEGFTVSDEEYTELVNYYIETYGLADQAEVEANIEKSSLCNSILLEKVEEFLEENITIETIESAGVIYD